MAEILDLQSALKLANERLPSVLERRFKQLDAWLQFGNPSPLVVTPDKSYTARTNVPVAFGTPGDMKVIGNLCVIAFAPGDGTGDLSTYSLHELEIPQRLRFVERPERVLPRSKKGVLMEAFFPFFSVRGERCYYGAVRLEELTLDLQEGKSGIRRGCFMGEAGRWYNQILSGDEQQNRSFEVVQLTTGYRRNGSRFGDPHAIHYPLRDVRQDALQVVGFLAVGNYDNPLCEILERKAIVPQGL